MSKSIPMTGNKLLLDTNIVIALFKGDSETLDFLEKQEVVYVSATVLGELYLGAYRSASVQKKLQEIKFFLINCIVLPTDAATSESYALIKTALLHKGKPIPENDIWIAAIAMQYELPLYTNDKHFTEVGGIKLI